MLKHQKQGPAECLITSIAILMDLDREKLLDVVRSKVVDKPWKYFNDEERVLSLETLKQEFRGLYPEWLEAKPTILTSELADTDLHFVEFHVDHFTGAMTIVHPYFGGHIVAFDHGTVVDSALESPLSFYHWLPKYRRYGFTVHSLHCDYESFK